MRYVIPYKLNLEDEINKMSSVKARLRAFPAQCRDLKLYSPEDYPYKINFPTHVEKVILDSGAFSLSQIGGTMDDSYLYALFQFYFYNADERCLCVAPDKYLDPITSMVNFKKFQDIIQEYEDFCDTGFTKNIKIAAVLQPTHNKRLDIKSMLKQAEFYLDYTDVIFISNPNLTSAEAKMLNIQKLLKQLRHLGVKYIHILGAGWSITDIKGWLNIGYADSIDSIAYYTTTDEKEFGSLEPLENIKNIMGVVNKWKPLK